MCGRKGANLVEIGRLRWKFASIASVTSSIGMGLKNVQMQYRDENVQEDYPKSFV